jgi:hypothetical protein
LHFMGGTMANNRMYLTDGVNKMLIAKGWGLNQWQIPKNFSLEDLELFLNNVNDGEVSGDCFVCFEIEYES